MRDVSVFRTEALFGMRGIRSNQHLVVGNGKPTQLLAWCVKREK